MSFDITTTPAVGSATRVNDYTRLRDSIKALAAVNHSLGGSLSQFIGDTAYVDLTDHWEWEIDGTNLAGLSVHLELNVKAASTNSGVVTVTMRLWNVTAAAPVASSEVNEVGLAAGARAYTKTGAFTLATGVNRYKAQIKTNGAALLVSGVARVSIRG